MPQMCTPTPTTTDMFLAMFAQRCHRLEGGGRGVVWEAMVCGFCCVGTVHVSNPRREENIPGKKIKSSVCHASPNKYASQPFENLGGFFKKTSYLNGESKVRKAKKML